MEEGNLFASPPAAVADDWQAALAACRDCPLCREGNRGPTGYTGPLSAPLMIVGEGPGAVEDEYGVPLVGPSGELLNRALASVGISREAVYVTNVIKCRPRGNRTPTPAEGLHCARRWLLQEIGAVNPVAILALGKAALTFFAAPFAKTAPGIVRRRGTWIDWAGMDGVAGRPVMPTFHPAYLLRLHGREEVRAKWQVYDDLQAVKARVETAVGTVAWGGATPPDWRRQWDTARAMRMQRKGEGR